MPLFTVDTSYEVLMVVIWSSSAYLDILRDVA